MNQDYWRQRFAMLEAADHRKSETYLRQLEKLYLDTQLAVQKEIEAWYGRFAKNNCITLTEAKKLLTSRQLEEFKWTVQQYVKAGEQAGLSQQWMKQLENASARFHISRLEAIQMQISQQIELLYGNQVDGIDALLRELIQNGYTRGAYEVQKGIGLGWDLVALDQGKLDALLAKPWTTDGRTFRDRCWSNKAALVDSLHKGLIQSTLRGDAPQKTIAAIQKQFGTARYQAARLVHTETSYFGAVSKRQMYGQLGVEQLEIVETLDSHTCALCQPMDGKVISLSQYQPGVTVPPFHPNCRGTTCPYYDDMEGERIARDAEGKVYYVPADMTYAEWKEKFVTKPAETQYNIFKAAVHEEIRKSYSLIVNIGMQNKHIRGTNNFDPSRSELTADPEELIRLYAGKSEPRRTNKGEWNHKEYFVHTSEIGIWRDLSGNEAPTTAGIIHYSKKKGLHIVPAQPVGGENHA